MSDDATVKAADIARLTGVGRAAVSNWRRRYDDFPQPVGGTAESPLFSLREVEQWLTAHGKVKAVAAEDLVWQRLRNSLGDLRLGDVLGYTGAFLLFLRRCPQKWRRLDALPDEEMARRLPGAVAEELGDLPGGRPPPRLGARNAPLVREVARLARHHGETQTFELLYERYAAQMRRAPSASPEAAAVMAALADVAGGDTVLDPACGTGTLLLQAAACGAARTVGQERDDAGARIAALRLLLRGHPAEVAAGDALRADAHAGLCADAVLCVPPYGDRHWGRDDLVGDPRWEYGLPARSEPELAWVQHALARLRPGGRALVLMPSAAAARPSGRRVRGQLLRAGALRAVIALPAGAAPQSPLAPHLWVLRRPDPADAPPGHALMLDLSGVGDWREVTAQACRRWREFTGRPGLRAGEPAGEHGRAVSLVELLDEEIDLTPARWARRQAAVTETAFAGLRDRLDKAVAALAGTVPEPGLLRPASGRRQAAARAATPLPAGVVTLAELVKAGAATIQHAAISMRTERGSVPVLTVRDVLAGRAATGRTPPGAGLLRLRAGDIVLPTTTRYHAVRVIGQGEDGTVLGPNLHLVRVDPAHFDPHYLAGFLRIAGRDNAPRLSTGSSRLDVRRVKIPRLPLDEQRSYAEVFRRLDALEQAMREAGELVEQVVRAGLEGLAGGSLRPRA
ncbi:type II restriction endonuclease subunit M [Actinomadura sp. NBRC 104425]|uniref:N-6 DNA methylase n=1 Tax=Actinomadura sp. NBRC 104425 TaxID=3032204 RepID=UPI0024A036ED|nr:N-6 DNA methylase [Actinomadura sp. NBRC 104425]GLZ14523.1 type II restriction endonuclease subunit M [Actinomadura sp. NBRC 104425]